jgi:hypothetical protein
MKQLFALTLLSALCLLSSCAATYKTATNSTETETLEITQAEHDPFQPDLVRYSSNYFTVIDYDKSADAGAYNVDLQIRIGYLQEAALEMWYLSMFRVANNSMNMSTLELLVNNHPTKLYAEPDPVLQSLLGVYFEATNFQISDALRDSFSDADSVRIRLTGSRGQLDADLTQNTIANIDSFIVYIKTIQERE